VKMYAFANFLPRSRLGDCHMGSEASHFFHRSNADGTFDSICMKCFRIVDSEKRDADLSGKEQAHLCATADLLHFERPGLMRADHYFAGVLSRLALQIPTRTVLARRPDPTQIERVKGKRRRMKKRSSRPIRVKVRINIKGIAMKERMIRFIRLRRPSAGS
jgi:hypothetical protein